MTRPLLLDLFCCEGGAAMGYHRAGFDVIGVDITDQPNYPFQFHRGDVLKVVAHLLAGGLLGGYDLRSFAAIHASPPCQASTSMSNRWRGAGGKADSHVNLIPEVRDLLEATGLPYVIENVPGAKRSLRDPVTLTGGQFGLQVHRPRLFESNLPLTTPAPAPAPKNSIGVYGVRPDGRLLWRRKDGTEQRAAASVEQARAAMGMPWASWRGCAEAIPPAYTEHIGQQLLQLVAV